MLGVTRVTLECTVNKHRQTTRPVFGEKSPTKPSTKLRAYFLGEIENPSDSILLSKCLENQSNNWLQDVLST